MFVGKKRKEKLGRESVSLDWSRLISVCRARIVEIRPSIFTSSEYIREKRGGPSITGWTLCWRITWQNSGISVGTGSRADLLSGVALLTSLSLRLTTLRELLVICRMPTISTQVKIICPCNGFSSFSYRISLSLSLTLPIKIFFSRPKGFLIYLQSRGFFRHIDH